MSDLPNVQGLMRASSDDAAPSGKKPKVMLASSAVEETFQKKMGQVADKQVEVDSIRFAASIGVPHINLEKFPVSHEALRKISREEVEELGMVCFFATNDELRFGAIDPTTEEALAYLEGLQERFQGNVGVYVISPNSFARVVKLYDTLPVVKPISKDVEIKPEDLEKVQADVNDFHALQSLVERTSTTDLVTFIMGAALKLDASDVHVEAEEEKIVLRFRLDGILHDAADLPREAFKQLVSRIKLISRLKINITDKPQDGRFTVKLSDGDIDIRVSTMPTVYGESIVMRLLRQNREGLSLDKVGLRGDAYERLKREIERPNGMIITTGPTGSGKTTTLYAIMHILNQPGVKIITLEDPVEYKMPGVNQSQIDQAKGYTFAKGLKSILRQDPDIAMVGEIRDLETADIAIQAALTGHLILSTIHTNSASGAIPRFLSMGVKPFLLAPALNSVIGQRLVRRICQECMVEDVLSPEQQARVEQTIAAMPESTRKSIEGKPHVFYKGNGCPVCNGLGYKGRIGIYEIFVMSPEVEQLILSGQVSEYDIEKIAVQNGMVTMVQDGILKALDKLTSVEEVFRVIE